jgi:nucleoside-diphosphate-sugar epimerase
MEVWRASAEGLNVAIVNPGLIIGSGNWKKQRNFVQRIGKNAYTFSGGTSYVDVRDVAKFR